MSSALPGRHYCDGHQGNHSIYGIENCEMCQLKRENKRLRTLPVEGYALRYKDKSYWAGIWNDYKVAEAVLAKMKDKRIKIVRVTELPLNVADVRTEMVHELAAAMGEDYARPQSPRQVWEELLKKIRRRFQ